MANKHSTNDVQMSNRVACAPPWRLSREFDQNRGLVKWKDMVAFILEGDGDGLGRRDAERMWS